ncbi:MAG: mannose-1-phosphate guanylyltransferase, partial [Acidobacteriia bacterium]|nr:mannose-1-phosphate guanylyltransferase [Terriglobia bacterium]
MAGGSGTRFWPRSRRSSAKQVLRLFGDRSLIQQTVDRLRSIISPERMWVITNQFLEAEIRKQLPEIPKRQVVAEPAARNTAPCIALAAHILSEIDPAAVMGVFPADHLITRQTRFRKYVNAAFNEAQISDVVILGVRPRWAETGYGYIEFQDGVRAGSMTAARVASFREKPDAATAKQYVQAGHFYWNASMFFWRACAVLDLMRHHQPKTATLLAGLPPFHSRTFFPKLSAAYPLCDGISVDYAIIEKAERVTALALDDVGWNDVGSWNAVYEVEKKDVDGNAKRAELIA